MVRCTISAWWAASSPLHTCPTISNVSQADADADGNGEREKVGEIAVLRDDDGDGRMDRREVFVDELVLPRAIAAVHGGVLALVPPRLVHYRDTDGDGRADVETVVWGMAFQTRSVFGREDLTPKQREQLTEEIRANGAGAALVGLNLDREKGTLTGTPTRAGIHVVQIRAARTKYTAASDRTYVLRIKP